MTDTPTPIPDDLIAWYKVATHQANAWPREYVVRLIERIAQAETRNEALVATLEVCLRIFGDTPEEQDAYAARCVTSEDAKFIGQARAAIAAQKE